MELKEKELDPLAKAFITTTIVITVLTVLAVCFCYYLCNNCCVKRRKAEFKSHHDSEADQTVSALNSNNISKRRGSEISTDREVEEALPDANYDPNNPE